MKKIVVLTVCVAVVVQACNPYSALNHTTTYTSDGLPNTVTDARGITRYTYDTPRNLTRVLQPNGQAVDYTYDLLGNRLSMSTSAGTTSYDYDAANQLIEVTGPNNAVTTFDYDNIGLRTQKALPNGVTTNYGYDELNRLTDIQQQKGSTTLASYAYVLDAAGNRLSVTEAGGSSIQWSYDDAYRLTNETRKNGSSIVAQSSFTYDLAGNRLSQQSMVNGQSSTVQYTYNDLDQLLTAGPINHQYDLRGNLISTTNSGQTVQYGYDAQDRLITTSLPDGTDITNTYDAGGHRVQQSVDSQITNYLWDEASIYGDVVLETGSGNTTSYVLAGSELLSQTRNGSTSYYMQDGQGSTRGLANSAGNLTDTYSYTAFGELQNQTGSTVNHYLYTGQQFDDSSGLYSLRARYYNPSVGRFLSQDTFAINFNNPIELNRYGYVGNNPINLMDPSGHEGTAGYANSYLLAFSIGAPTLKAVADFITVGIAGIAVFLLITQSTVDAPPRVNWVKWLYNLPLGTSNTSPPSGGGGLSKAALVAAAVLAELLNLQSSDDSGAQQSGKVIVDLGSGTGEWARELKIINPDARVIATETGDMFHVLQALLAGSGVEVNYGWDSVATGIADVTWAVAPQSGITQPNLLQEEGEAGLRITKPGGIFHLVYSRDEIQRESDMLMKLNRISETQNWNIMPTTYRRARYYLRRRESFPKWPFEG